MELDWSTFFLEIVNFLILVWILKRFLYKPILNAIAARRKMIDDTLGDAASIREQALALKAQNENRFGEWQKEQQIHESKLAGEIAVRRNHMLSDLDAELEREKKKKAAQDARQIREWQHDATEKALVHAAGFASRLLQRLASSELESRLLDVFIEDLKQLDANETGPLSADAPGLNLVVSSAYPLPPERRNLLVAAMGEIAGRPLSATFEENPDLLCGIWVSLGPWVLQANLRDELEFFRGASRNAL